MQRPPNNSITNNPPLLPVPTSFVPAPTSQPPFPHPQSVAPNERVLTSFGINKFQKAEPPRLQHPPPYPVLLPPPLPGAPGFAPGQPLLPLPGQFPAPFPQMGYGHQGDRFGPQTNQGRGGFGGRGRGGRGGRGGGQHPHRGGRFDHGGNFRGGQGGNRAGDHGGRDFPFFNPRFLENPWRELEQAAGLGPQPEKQPAMPFVPAAPERPPPEKKKTAVPIAIIPIIAPEDPVQSAPTSNPEEIDI